MIPSATNFQFQTKTKIIVQSAVTFILAIALLLVGAYFFYTFKAEQQECSIQTQIHRNLDTIRQLILKEFDAPLTELLYLANISEASEAFTSIISPEHLADLTLLSRIKKKYDQIRLIDRYGMEIVRINYNNGSPAAVQSDKLQFKGTHPYFTRANILDKNQIYISALDLNVEKNIVQQPLTPAIRLATPLFDEEGVRRGLALLNYFGAYLFSPLEKSVRQPGEQLFLLNGDGYYLYSPTPENNWGFMFDDKKDLTFQSRFPSAWAKIKNSNSSKFSNKNGVFNFSTICPETAANNSEAQIVSDAGCWKLVSFIPQTVIADNNWILAQNIIHVVIIFSIIALLASILIGRLRLSNAQAQIAIDEKTKSYGRFVPREFLSLLHKERFRDVTLESNVRKSMGILFSDIRSYTSISETLEPEEVLTFLNGYFKSINKAISDNRGFVDSFHGDALLALFPENPDQAIMAAIHMRQKLKVYNKNREDENLDPVEIGIGIHFGEVTLGTVGTTYRMQATVIGDAVNLASRIESATKTFKIDIVVTGKALKKMVNPESFHLREIDTVRVKGKENPVVLYEVFDNDPPEIRKIKSDLIPIMKRALSHYKKGEFKQALELFKACAKTCPEDSIPPIYIKRCSTFIRIPPGPGWAGVSSV